MTITDASAAPPADLDSEIASVFGFDSAPAAAPAAAEPAEGVAAPSPSAEPAAPAAPAAEPAPAVQEPAPAAPAAPLPPLAAPAPAPAAPAPAVVTPAVTPPTPQDLELQSLRARVEALTLAAQQPQPAAAAAPATGAPAAEVPAYSLSIPDELSNAIFSEDPAQARAGMTHLVNSLAVHIHQTVKADFDKALAQRDQQSQQQQYQEQERTNIQTMQDDYYGTYPTHNNPVIKQIVSLEAGKLATEFPGLPWGPQYRDALGHRVNAAIAELAGQPAPAAPATPAVPAVVPVPPRAAAFAPSGARPAEAPIGSQSDEDVISNTFGVGWTS